MDPSEKQAARYRSKNLMGYIQDKVDVGMTKIRGDEGKALDVAIVKATLQDEVVPKEKHVVTLKVACAPTSPRMAVNYVIHGLSKRLEDKSGWLVTLKTLIVFHRLLREVDVSFQVRGWGLGRGLQHNNGCRFFRTLHAPSNIITPAQTQDEIIRYQERTGAHRMLRLEAFADHTTKDTWDYSAWVRVYSIYLDERLGVFKNMRFDPELESGGGGHAPPPPAYGGMGGPYGGATGGPYAGATGVTGYQQPTPAAGDAGTGGGGKDSKLKNCPAGELMEKLPLVSVGVCCWWWCMCVCWWWWCVCVGVCVWVGGGGGVCVCAVGGVGVCFWGRAACGLKGAP